MTEKINIELLADRLKNEEVKNEKQSTEISNIRTLLDKMIGAEEQNTKTAGWAQKLVPYGLGLGAAIFGTVVFGAIQNLETKQNQDELAIVKLESEIKHTLQEIQSHGEELGHPGTMNTRLAVLESKSKPVSLGKINVTIENINTRLAEIEKELASGDGDFEDLTETVVELRSDVKSINTTLDKNLQIIDRNTDGVSTLREKLSSGLASTQAAFVEVETQIRATTDIMNLSFSEIDRYMQIIWHKAFGTSMPEKEFFPSNIPAQATTSVGRISGN